MQVTEMKTIAQQKKPSKDSDAGKRRKGYTEKL